MALSKITNASVSDNAVHGRRNLILNGSQIIAQRSISSTAVGGYRTVDRWYFNVNGSYDQLAVTQSQDSDAPAGFAKSLKFLVNTAETTLDAAENSNFGQAIEAQNLQQLAYGTSSAKSFTLSFWVKSNVTGNYSVTAYKQTGSNRQADKQYTINSANTWEYKTLTFAGDTSQSIADDNGVGIYLYWHVSTGSDLGSGSTNYDWTSYSNAGWAAGQEVNLFSAVNNYLNITGVQLEVGDASPFEHRSYGEELAACQRYFQNTNSFCLFAGRGTGTTSGVASYVLTVPLRASPTVANNSLDLRGYTSSAVDVSSTAPTVTSYSSTDNLLTLGCTGFDNLVDDRVINFQISGSANQSTGFGLDAEL